MPPPKMDILDEIRKHRSNCPLLLEKFQKANINCEDVANAKNKSGWLPLHFVMVFCKGPGILELVQFLWRRHPSCVQAKTTDRGTLPINLMPPTTNPQPVIDAMQRDQLQARLYLMKKYPPAIRMEDKDGETPLVRAVIGRCNILVKAMIQRFPELATETNNKGRLPLHYAMETANAGAVNILYGAYPQGIDVDDHMGITPYYIFAHLPNKDPVIAALVDLMCEVFELDDDQATQQPSQAQSQTQQQSQQSQQSQTQESTEIIYKQMLPQYAIDSNISVWNEKVIWRLVNNWRQVNQPILPEIPETPRESTTNTFSTRGNNNRRTTFASSKSSSSSSNGMKDSMTDLRNPKTPTRDATSFSKYTKKGQFEALRASFETGAVKG